MPRAPLFGVKETKRVPVASLRPHPMNPNKGNVPEIMQSLMFFGQYRTIVANKDLTILAGHHVYYAALELGYAELDVSFVDVDEAQALRILLADNRLAELGVVDEEKLLLAVQTAQQTELGLAGTGMDDRYADDLEAQHEEAQVLEAPEFKGTYGETEEEYAARLAKAAPGMGLREIVLLYDVPTHKEFSFMILELRKKWKTGNVPATVLRALRELTADIASESTPDVRIHNTVEPPPVISVELNDKRIINVTVEPSEEVEVEVGVGKDGRAD